MSTTFLCRCGGTTGVKDSRQGAGQSIRRRRECHKCGERVTTWETTCNTADGVLGRAESVSRKAELLLAAAASLLEDLEGLREITKAYRTIEAARYGGVLRQ